MSRKARSRSQKCRHGERNASVLQRQKQCLLEACLSALGVAALFLVATLSLLGIGLIKLSSPYAPYLFLAVAAAFGGFFACVTLLLRRGLLYREFRKIRFSTEEERVILCKRVRFRLRSVSKYSSEILYIALQSEMGERYFYVTDGISDFARKGISAMLEGKRVELTCYRGTCFVKHIPFST